MSVQKEGLIHSSRQNIFVPKTGCPLWADCSWGKQGPTPCWPRAADHLGAQPAVGPALWKVLLHHLYFHLLGEHVICHVVRLELDSPPSSSFLCLRRYYWKHQFSFCSFFKLCSHFQLLSFIACILWIINVNGIFVAEIILLDLWWHSPGVYPLFCYLLDMLLEQITLLLGFHKCI